MTQPTYIPPTDPLCQALQGGYDSYHEGLLIADGHITGPDGSCLIEAPEAARVAPGYRRPEETTANVRPLGVRHGGLRVYGIRFFQ